MNSKSTRLSQPHKVVPVLTLLMSMLPGAPLWAAEPVAVSGRTPHKTEKVEVLLEDKKSGRMIVYVEDTATTMERTKSGVLDGARGKCGGMWDTTHGIGDGRGLCTLNKGGDSYSFQWTGTCYAMKASDGSSIDRCSGGWALLPESGTGQYAGVKGGGAWWGQAQPNGDFEDEWHGYIQK